MPKRLTESEKLVRIDLWIKPATKEEVDAEASRRDLTRQAVIRERVERGFAGRMKKKDCASY